MGWATEFIDFDNDGWLDIYVVNGVIGMPVEITGEGKGHGKSVFEPNALYRSNGDGTFSDVTGRAGLDVSGGIVALWMDLFNGRTDLFVFGSGDGTRPTRLFMNEPGLAFREVTAVSGLAPGGIGDGPGDASSAGAETGSGAIVDAILLDYDADGYQDLLLTRAGGNALYRNNGDGTFSDATGTAGLAGPVPGTGTGPVPGTGTGAGFIDLDNDGLLDLYVVNSGGVSDAGSARARGLPNRMYRNNGDGTFVDVTRQSGLGDTGEAVAVGFADYDYDGDVDIYVVNADGPNVLYRNEAGGRNGWLRISLRGISSNLRGIGARVEVTTPDGLTRVAFPAGGPEFGGQSDAQALVGLGDAERANIRVIWPSGLVQDFWGAIPNELIRLREVAMEGW